MKKLCQIRIIPIQKEIEIGDICKSNVSNTIGLVKDIRLINNIKSIDCNPQFLLEYYQCKSQQLILFYEEEIKENYWYINGIYLYKADKYYEKAHNDKKIIAAYHPLYNIPTFSKEFIQKWCKNPVEEVEVQYDSYQEYKGSKPFIKQDLILTSNNEVICNIPSSDYRDKINNPLKKLKNELETNSNKIDFDKEIEKAAKEYQESLNNWDEYCKESFIAGVKSEIAEIYWLSNLKENELQFQKWNDELLKQIQGLEYDIKKMYSEQEIKFAFLAGEDAIRAINMNKKAVTFKEWFEPHKKK